MDIEDQLLYDVPLLIKIIFHNLLNNIYRERVVSSIKMNISGDPFHCGLL